MDLSQVMTSNITFSKATLEDIIARYSVKTQGRASTANKTPASVKTAMSTLRQAYARVHGDKPDDFGDLTWLTTAKLKKPSKFATARPLFEGAQHPDANEAMSVPLEPGTVRKNLENFRAVLYAAAKHLQTVDMEQPERTRLNESYNAAYMEFGKLSGDLMEAEQNRLATREPSQRQQSKWVSWPDLRKLLKTVIQSLDTTFRAAPETMSVTDNKKMQRSLQFAIYMMVPPMRNNFAGLRFIAPHEENLAALQESNSPNYIIVKDDGTMELVINRYKIDGRSRAVDYDPETDFGINTDATKRFPLTADATLAKYGFDPVKLGALLMNYWTLQQALMGDSNPYDLVFFELKRDQSVASMTAEGMATRMSRITQRLTGQTLGSTMFRTIFLSWFNKKGPSMADRESIADRMMHSVKTQLGTYTKSAQKRSPRTLEGSGAKKQKITVQTMRI